MSIETDVIELLKKLEGTKELQNSKPINYSWSITRKQNVMLIHSILIYQNVGMH